MQGILYKQDSVPSKNYGLDNMTDDVAKDRFETYFMYEVNKANGLDNEDEEKRRTRFFLLLF